MSLVYFRCIICGIHIRGAEDGAAAADSWLQEFRTVWWDATEPRVSVVGLYTRVDEGDFIVPVDSHKAWNTIGIADETAAVPVMNQRPDEDMHGYLLHAACWSFLESYMAPQKVDIARFLEVCDSIPYSPECEGLAWEHRYGGIFYREDRIGVTWDKDYRVAESAPGLDLPMNHPAIADPRKTSFTPPEGYTNDKPPKGPTGYGSMPDSFAQFPLELREIIAGSLSTQEVFALRSASRSFLPIFESKTFWRSRFRPEGDRGFLSDSLENRDKVDLRALWRATTKHKRHQLSNRQRVWLIMQSIVPLMTTYVSVVTPGSIKRQSHHFEVSANVINEFTFPPPCLLWPGGSTEVGSQQISWPEGVVQLRVSIVDAGGVRYITGLELTTKDGSSVCLGYMSPDVQSCEIDSEVTGFITAMSTKGVHAIRVVCKERRSPHWLGDSTGLPITERLTNVDPIFNIGIKYDGFKIVSLAVGGTKRPQPVISEGCSAGLRMQALWYPSVPPLGLHIEENKSCPPDYDPIHWTHFGGPRGSQLKYLTSVVISRRNGIRSVSFNYADHSPAIAAQHLGRSEAPDYCTLEHLPIDGPAGERITSIAVGFGLFRNQHMLFSLSIQTSWNRELRSPPEQPSSEDQAGSDADDGDRIPDDIEDRRSLDSLDRPYAHDADTRHLIAQYEAAHSAAAGPSSTERTSTRYIDPTDPYADDGVPSESDFGPRNTDSRYDFVFGRPDVTDFQVLPIPMSHNAIITGLWATQDPGYGITRLGLMTETVDSGR